MRRFLRLVSVAVAVLMLSGCAIPEAWKPNELGIGACTIEHTADVDEPSSPDLTDVAEAPNILACWRMESPASDSR